MASPNRHIQFDPKLDERFGTKGALLLALVEFRSRLNEEDAEGYRWAALSHQTIVDEWIPSASVSTIKRELEKLLSAGVLRKTFAHPGTWDRTCAYAINFERLRKNVPTALLIQNHDAPSGQFDQMQQVNMTSRRAHSDPMEQVKLNSSYIEKNYSRNKYQEEKELVSSFK